MDTHMSLQFAFLRTWQVCIYHSPASCDISHFRVPTLWDGSHLQEYGVQYSITHNKKWCVWRGVMKVARCKSHRFWTYILICLAWLPIGEIIDKMIARDQGFCTLNGWPEEIG